MSSCPGLTLESFVLWNFNLTADGQGDANFSLMVAEKIGNIKRRSHLSAEEFTKLLAFYESHRELVEDKLLEFDEDNQSWRMYAGYAFDFVLEGDVNKQAQTYLRSLTTQGN